MMWKNYRKKPVRVKAVFVTAENVAEVVKSINVESGAPAVNPVAVYSDGQIHIRTLEGVMSGRVGECYAVRGVAGEYYLVRKDIFEETYVEEESESGWLAGE